ncbi:hypothetical protein [Actinoplanes regularis]|uniref:hypothetical protein n=1 Tax=Actinoplanes regularis TaxID=52697 RepID=UPI0024A22096|nr:hypothetical protein [Actinoplanes regularis]GLW30050.1 hypothetical protein Areg01_29900 [Actinoplanes regularis]
MDERMNDLQNLAVLDPARDREPTAMEWTRSQAFVERVMAAEVTARPAHQVRRRWMLAGAAAVAAGVVGAVAVPALFPGAAQEAVASWTAAPTSRTGEQVLPQARQCAGNGVGGTTTATPDDVVLAEQRGKATLLVMRKGGSVIECLSTGADQFAAMGLTDATTKPPAPAHDGVTLETMSSFGEGRSMWSNIIGFAGPGVTAVEIRTDGGRVFQASVKAGWWAAWWPGAEGGEVDTLTVTVHTAAGTTSHRPSELP